MGEAKLRRKREKAMLLSEWADWTRPPTPEEALLVAEIDKLPTVTVQRQPVEALTWGRMKAKECHANCQWYEDNDPNGEHKAVRGWWKQPNGIHMLHSVIRRGDDYACITPGPPPDFYQFAPDPEILFVNDERGSLKRRGQIPPKFVRSDPERTIKAYTLLAQRINAGMDLVKAEQIDWSTL